MITRKQQPDKQVMYRQGDVMLKRIDQKPASAKPDKLDNGRIILAYGEVTGHAHAIAQDEANIFIDGTRRFLEVCYEKQAHLKHEEHATIVLPPGTYEVLQQREYSCLTQMSRQVID
jgi:hypothetical protein